MYKLSAFLKRNFMKIIWSAAILVWVGVGIYYFSTTNKLSFLEPFTSEIISKFIAPTTTSTPGFISTTTPSISDSFDDVEFIRGNFQEWKEIENSEDRYVVLVDIETGKLFPMVRVGFEFSTLFGHKERKDATVFAVEKSVEEYDVLRYFMDFTSEEVGKLVKEGDYIKIVLRKDIVEENEEAIVDLIRKNSKDESGNLLAHWLFIKRTGGKSDIEKDLGREVPEI